MKELLLTLLCAVAGSVSGSVVGWPAAEVRLASPLLKTTVFPAETKSFAYSTTQYLNSLPASYSLGLQPQLTYHYPQLSAFAPLQSYYTVGGASYFPSSSVFYPPASIIPAIPEQPAAPGYPSGQPAPPGQSGQPAQPGQQGGDADTAVIDSAELSQQQDQQPTSGFPTQTQPSTPQFPPANNFPSFPQLPQIPGQVPSLPQIPQIPQIPQGSVPGLPQFPQLPSNPSIPQPPSPSPPSFPSADSGDKGLNDEDTISVESA